MQSVQSSSPLALVLPSGQFTQLVETAMVPAGQPSSQLVLPALLVVPPAQGSHSVAPGDELNLPCSQGRH